MIQRMSVTVEGVSPILMHNGLGADPMNPYVIKMAAINAKKKNKTEADQDELTRLGWYSGLYVNEAEKPIIPSILIEACIVSGAKKTRKGKDMQCGMSVFDDAVVNFPDAGKSLDWLFESGRYVDRRMVSIQKSKVVRVRPRFDVWSISFDVDFDDEVTNGKDVLSYIDTAGLYCGLGDFRPRFGRFKRVS